MHMFNLEVHTDLPDSGMFGAGIIVHVKFTKLAVAVAAFSRLVMFRSKD
jgi:hypothetical protein